MPLEKVVYLTPKRGRGLRSGPRDGDGGSGIGEAQGMFQCSPFG